MSDEWHARERAAQDCQQWDNLPEWARDHYRNH